MMRLAVRVELRASMKVATDDSVLEKKTEVNPKMMANATLIKEIEKCILASMKADIMWREVCTAPC